MGTDTTTNPPRSRFPRLAVQGVIAGLTVFALVATACTGKPAPGGTAGAAQTKFEVVANEFKFAPSTLKVDKPGTIQVTLVNKGVAEHDLVIKGIEGRVLAPAGKSVTGNFTIPAAGSYEFLCSITGHADAGMVGHVMAGDTAVVQNQPAANAPKTVAAVQPAVANAKPLGVPQMAPALNRTTPTTVDVEIETREVIGQLADGVTYKYWTFNGTVPGPMVRVLQGDTVNVTLRNAKDSEVTHSIDLHAVTGPGGGAKATQIPPGGSASFRFKAVNPGVYVYHCATPMVAHHIASGMYGLIVVEPEGGLPKVDHEFYVMQGDFYVKGERGQAGHQEFSLPKMLDEKADYVLFNGGVGAVTGNQALKAKVGDTVRIFFGVGGPNVTSSFHVIGEIFDKVYSEGASEVQTNVQTTLVPAGGATIVEFKLDVPGDYVLVDHSLSRLEKGAAGILTVEGPDNPEVFQVLGSN
ncbi:MAG: copper-containing nitrite reductase [Dehalococcoidia bacterium]